MFCIGDDRISANCKLKNTLASSHPFEFFGSLVPGSVSGFSSTGALRDVSRGGSWPKSAGESIGPFWGVSWERSGGPSDDGGSTGLINSLHPSWRSFSVLHVLWCFRNPRRPLHFLPHTHVIVGSVLFSFWLVNTSVFTFRPSGCELLGACVFWSASFDVIRDYIKKQDCL